MRTLLGFLVGLLVGAVGMIWFYTNGGSIMIAGRELGPPIAYVSGGQDSKAPAKQAQPSAPRLVVRDITDEPARSEPPRSQGADTAAAKGAGQSSPRPRDPSASEFRFPSDTGSLVTIAWPKW